MSRITLTQIQKAKIYCIKYGHANYFTSCFGYIHCGRCSEQIGDTLAGVFDTSHMIMVGHKCKNCNRLKTKLSYLDKKILKRLEEAEAFPDYEKILVGIFK